MTSTPDYPTGATATGGAAVAEASSPATRTVTDCGEVHVNTVEGHWPLPRSWLRPHQGISQGLLPLYLGFFEFGHNVRRGGKGLLGSLLAFFGGRW